MIRDHISPWSPEQDKVRLAVLIKLIEECNELSGRAARCIAQGVDEVDPDTGRTNREEMSREVSDVIACLQKLNGEMGISGDPDRVNSKFLGYGRWHDMIRGAQIQGEQS